MGRRQAGRAGSSQVWQRLPALGCRPPVASGHVLAATRAVSADGRGGCGACPGRRPKSCICPTHPQGISIRLVQSPSGPLARWPYPRISMPGSGILWRVRVWITAGVGLAGSPVSCRLLASAQVGPQRFGLADPALDQLVGRRVGTILGHGNNPDSSRPGYHGGVAGAWQGEDLVLQSRPRSVSFPRPDMTGSRPGCDRWCCRCSSGVEHPLGKGEVESSILSGGTSLQAEKTRQNQCLAGTFGPIHIAGRDRNAGRPYRNVTGSASR